MTLLPASFLRDCRTAAHKRDVIDLNLLLAFRDILEENKGRDGKPKHPIGQLYAEFAENYMRSQNTLERKMRAIREYPADKLQGWLNAGISFDHFENANDFQNFPPAALLDLAMDAGEGKPATVEQMISLANGGKPPSPAESKINRAWDFIRKIPHWIGLSDAMKDEFLADVEQLRLKWADWLKAAPPEVKS